MTTVKPELYILEIGIMNKRQAGFTLIELVVVILILGLLAAVALPRYADLAKQARISSINGVAGGLRGAVALVRAQYIVNGSTTATSVTMLDSTVVTTNAGVNGGFPVSGAGGIDNAMPTPDGYTFAAGVSPAPSTYTPDSGGSSTCRVEYLPTGIVTPVTTGC